MILVVLFSIVGYSRWFLCYRVVGLYLVLLGVGLLFEGYGCCYGGLFGLYFSSYVGCFVGLLIGWSS